MENTRDRFESFTTCIMKINKLIQRIKLLEMEGYGLKSIHVMCIHYLYVYGDGLTVSGLSRLAVEDKAAVSRALRTLQEKGYVTDASGKYNEPIRLTEKGAEIAESISARAAEAVIAAGLFLSEKERALLYSSLETVADRLQVYCESLTENKTSGGGN